MVHTFTKHDRPAIHAAVELLLKATDQAVAACDKIGVATAEIMALAGRGKEIDAILHRNIDRERFEIPTGLSAALRIAFSLELDKLGKISKGQMELSIDPDDTNARVLQVERLIAQLNGVAELTAA